MKRTAFTIAFGKERYKIMARALEKTLARHAPDVEFRIFTEEDITPYEEGLPKGRKLYPKDYKYPKIEIMTRLKDPDTQYLFIDADCFVFCGLDHIFNRIESGKLLMHWIYNEDGSWAGIPGLNFVEGWKAAGIDGLEPYSLNSGFIGWQGHMECFDRALELIRNYTVTADDKGRRGDEYYYCAGIQLTRTPVISTEDFDNELGMLWRGRLGYEGGRLTCDYYGRPKLIQHYGARNWASPHVQRIINETLAGSETPSERAARQAYTVATLLTERGKNVLRAVRKSCAPVPAANRKTG